MAVEIRNKRQDYDDEKTEEAVKTGFFNLNWKTVAKILKWAAIIIIPGAVIYWLIKKKLPMLIGTLTGLPGNVFGKLKGYGENAWDIMKYSLGSGKLISPEEAASIKEAYAQDERFAIEEAAQKQQIEEMYKKGGVVAADKTMAKRWADDLNLLQKETTVGPSNKIIIPIPYNGNVYTAMCPKIIAEEIWGTSTDNYRIGGSLMAMIYNRYDTQFLKSTPKEIAARIKGWENLWTSGADYWRPRMANYYNAYLATSKPTETKKEESKTDDEMSSIDTQYDLFEIDE